MSAYYLADTPQRPTTFLIYTRPTIFNYDYTRGTIYDILQRLTTYLIYRGTPHIWYFINQGTTTYLIYPRGPPFIWYIPGAHRISYIYQGTTTYLIHQGFTTYIYQIPSLNWYTQHHLSFLSETIFYYYMVLISQLVLAFQSIGAAW